MSMSSVLDHSKLTTFIVLELSIKHLLTTISKTYLARSHVHVGCINFVHMASIRISVNSFVETSLYATHTLGSRKMMVSNGHDFAFLNISVG